MDEPALRLTALLLSGISATCAVGWAHAWAHAKRLERLLMSSFEDLLQGKEDAHDAGH